MKNLTNLYNILTEAPKRCIYALKASNSNDVYIGWTYSLPNRLMAVIASNGVINRSTRINPIGLEVIVLYDDTDNPINEYTENSLKLIASEWIKEYKDKGYNVLNKTPYNVIKPSVFIEQHEGSDVLSIQVSLVNKRYRALGVIAVFNSYKEAKDYVQSQSLLQMYNRLLNIKGLDSIDTGIAENTGKVVLYRSNT